MISSFKSFIADEHVRVYADTQPHLLQKCFGISCNQYTDPGKTRIKGRQVQYIAELLIPDEAESMADYEHKYWGIYSGITRHSYGKGCAYYIGCYTEKDVLKDLYKAALADASVPAPELTWPVTVRSGVNQEGALLHYILHYSEDNRTISCPYEDVKDILTGKTYKKGEPISLKDWDVLILEENKL